MPVRIPPQAENTSNTSFYTIFFQDGDAVQQEIFKTKMTLTGSIHAGVNVLKSTPNTALLWPKVSLEILFEGSCEYLTIPNMDFLTPMTFYLKKGSPYRELLNYQ